MTQMYSLAVLESNLKSRCQQACICPGGYREESVSLPFSVPRSYLHSLACGPSLPSLHLLVIASLTLTLSPHLIRTIVMTLGDENY